MAMSNGYSCVNTVFVQRKEVNRNGHVANGLMKSLGAIAFLSILLLMLTVVIVLDDARAKQYPNFKTKIALYQLKR